MALRIKVNLESGITLEESYIRIKDISGNENSFTSRIGSYVD
ncbi:hypothetical protein ACBZ92_06225 [Priestia aryabhattai]